MPKVVLDDQWIRASAVAGIPEGKAREDYQDQTTPMLILRASRNGGLVWTVKYRIGQQQRRLKLGAFPALRIDAARKKAHAALKSIEDGGDPSADKKRRRYELTLGELYARYRAEHSLNNKAPKTIRDDDYYFANYIPADWKRRKVSAEWEPEIKRLHKAHRRHATAANRMVRLLSHLFNWAKDHDEGLFKGDNPVNVKQFKEQERERFLSPDELRRIGAALQAEDQQWAAYFALALLLGNRRSELLAVRWEDVNFAEAVIKFPKTKAGRKHTLPLSLQAVQVLQSLSSRGSSEWVFPGRGKSGHLVEPMKAWRRVKERAGVMDIRIHDLRHTNGAWLTSQRVNVQTVAKVLNHSQLSTTRRYATADLDAVRAALDVNAAAMGEIMGFGTDAPKPALMIEMEAKGEGNEN